jgi:hypothetical protein
MLPGSEALITDGVSLPLVTLRTRDREDSPITFNDRVPEGLSDMSLIAASATVIATISTGHRACFPFLEQQGSGPCLVDMRWGSRTARGYRAGRDGIRSTADQHRPQIGAQNGLFALKWGGL